MTFTKALRSSLVGTVFALASFGLAHPALAHAHLKSATPAADATLATSPTELKLRFSEALELKFTTLKVTGANKAVVPTGEPALDSGDGTVLIVPLSGTLPAGRYRVEWHATATDTHKTQGDYSFTVKP